MQTSLLRARRASWLLAVCFSGCAAVATSDAAPDVGVLDAPTNDVMRRDAGLDAPEDCGAVAYDAPLGTIWCGPAVCGAESACCHRGTTSCSMFECVPRDAPYPEGCLVIECLGTDATSCAPGEGCCWAGGATPGMLCRPLGEACDQWACSVGTSGSAPCPSGFECRTVGDLEPTTLCVALDADAG